MQNNLTLWEESGSGREFLKYWEPMAVEGRSRSTSLDPSGRTDPHLHFDSKSCVGMLCSPFCQYPRNESRNLCSQQHGLLQNEHSQGSAGRDGKQHTHCRLQLRKNHHRQKKHHQPRTGQAKLYICYVQVYSTTGQEAEGKPSSWTMHSPTGHINVCTDFSKTDERSPTCSLQLSAVSECPENHWKIEKKISSGASLKTHCMRNFPPSDCILIVAQIVS